MKQVGYIKAELPLMLLIHKKRLKLYFGMVHLKFNLYGILWNRNLGALFQDSLKTLDSSSSLLYPSFKA